MLEDLEGVQIEAVKTAQVVEVVKQQSAISFNQVMGMVHAGWLTTQGMVRAAGGTIQTVFRTVVGTTLGAIATLQPIFTAQAAAGDYVRAALGMISIATSLAALTAMREDQKAASDALRGANMALHGLSSMVGGMYFLN